MQNIEERIQIGEVKTSVPVPMALLTSQFATRYSLFNIQFSTIGWRVNTQSAIRILHSAILW